MTPAVEIRELSVVFPMRRGAVKAVDDLSLRIGQGQIVGFLGPNGAGKTTTLHVLLGFIAPTSGSARIFGTDVQHSIARRRLGYLPEHPDTYRFLTGRELLVLTGRLFGLGRRALGTRVGAVLEQTGMAEAADRRIGTYSRGMMQRICLAQALINDPDLVILDEPTGGLDPIGRMAVRRIITDLRDRGKTVFFSSHELSEVELVCDRIAILSRGRVVVEGMPTQLVKPGERLEQYFMRVVGDAEEPSVR
jgi:ABC-2 type transport system ATP-binding protein